MSLFGILDWLGLHARLATALAPTVVAVVARFLLGSNRVTRVLLWAAPVWLAASVLLAPFSADMQRELLDLTRFLH
jgi:hypothetical protein